LSDNQFFKPTVLYKEYMILDMIEKNPNITQREMSKALGIAVSMVNDHVDQYEKDKLIKRKKHSTKTVEYFVTKKGSERRKLLNIEFLSASQKLYNNAKSNINSFLQNITESGLKKLVLYGAGEVAEILAQSIIENDEYGLEIIGIADDDATKQGKRIGNISIYSLEYATSLDFDAILLSSYNNRMVMMEKVLAKTIDKSKIINFFDGE